MQNYNKKWILKEHVRQAILKDAELFAKVANAIDVMPVSMPKIVWGNSPKLTQYACLYALSKHLGISQKELLTEEETACSQPS